MKMLSAVSGPGEGLGSGPAAGVDRTRSCGAAAGTARSDGAQPPAGSERVPRGPVTPAAGPPPKPSSGRAQRALRRSQSEAGVDDERLARDPARLVAREIDRAPADVPAGPLRRERARAPPALARVGAEVLDHRRPHGPRRDRIDADPLGAELDGDRADEPDHAGLGRRVRGPTVATERRDRGDADDGAPAMADHRGHGRLRSEEHGLEVDTDYAIPLCLGRVEQVLARLDPDVVVEDVEAAPPLDRRLDHRGALGGARHVGGVGYRLAALGTDQAGALLGAFLHLVHAEDPGPFAGEEDRSGLAVAQARASRAGARHDRDLATEPSAHGAFTSRSADRGSRPRRAVSRRR